MTIPFEGFGPSALAFFKALDFHQNREWFCENRALYDEHVLAPLGALIESLNGLCIARDLPLRGRPKASIFRIQRDVRFSKDKRPYKTHAGAVMTRAGTKGDAGLFYVHIAPEGCFIATGFYAPEPPQLAAIRAAILACSRHFIAMQEALAQQGLVFDRQWSLKRAPREAAGLEDPALVEALKLKSFIIRQPVDEATIYTRTLADSCMALIERTMPLLEFGWSALSVPVKAGTTEKNT